MELILSKGFVAIVDDDDSREPWKYKWTADVRKNTVYAYRLFYGKKRYLHNFLLNTKTKVDHEDRDGLNNRRKNLRKATSNQNVANARLCSVSTSGYKGVSWNKHAQKWTAQLHIDNGKKHLGVFDNKEDAARAYDTAAVEHFGPYALTNDALLLYNLYTQRRLQ